MEHYNILKDFYDRDNSSQGNKDATLLEIWANSEYNQIYKNINSSFKKFELMSLEYISTKLSNLRNSNISLPGTYGPSYQGTELFEGIGCELKDFPGVRIKKMGKTLKIFNTKQHPRQLSMIGTDDKEYLFLLKGHEDFG